MAKLLMISGDTALATGKKGAFYNTMEEFHKYWDRIDVICPSIGNQEVVSLFDNVFFHPSRHHRILQPSWIYRKGKEIYAEQKFNVMTVHDYPPFYNGMGAWALSGAIGVPYLEEIFHIVGHPKAGSLKESCYKFLTYIAAPFITLRAKKVRVMNKNQVPSFLIKAGVKKNKLEYIPAVYLDTDVFKDLGMTKVFDTIFVGRIVENKGINILLDAVKETQLSLLIVGEGPLKEELEQKVQSWGKSDKIKFYGWAKDSAEIAELINKSKIFVMSSYNEGGPRTVVEAMACGTPILATPVGIVPDLVEDGYPIGLNSWGSEELKEKITKLLGDKDLYDTCVKEGKNLAQNFNKKSAIQYYATQLKLLARHE